MDGEEGKCNRQIHIDRYIQTEIETQDVVGEYLQRQQ